MIKVNKLLFIIQILCFSAITMFPKTMLASKGISIIVSSDGATIDDAINSALRSALEQTYGAFISSNTTILDDILLEDEIVSLSSGTVKSYKTITKEQMPNGRWYVMLEATVGMNEFASFVNSKGNSVEVDMDSFDANIKMAEMNRISEKKIISNAIAQVQSINELWDYELTFAEPRVRNNQYVIYGIVKVKYNSNSIAAVKILKDALENVAMSKKEIEQYELWGIDYYPVWVGDFLFEGAIFLRNKYENELITQYGKGGLHDYCNPTHKISWRGSHDSGYCEIKQTIMTDRFCDFVIGDNISIPTKLNYGKGEDKEIYPFKEKKYLKDFNYYSVFSYYSTEFKLLFRKRKLYKVGNRIGTVYVSITIPEEEVSKYKKFSIHSL